LSNSGQHAEPYRSADAADCEQPADSRVITSSNSFFQGRIGSGK
jgi:hypothetical protein